MTIDDHGDALKLDRRFKPASDVHGVLGHGTLGRGILQTRVDER
jgi:hypothetical protein